VYLYTVALEFNFYDVIGEQGRSCDGGLELSTLSTGGRGRTKLAFVGHPLQYVGVLVRQTSLITQYLGEYCTVLWT